MNGGWIFLLLLDHGTPPVDVAQVCPYIKIGRSFLAIGSSYVMIGQCTAAPVQTTFVGLPGRCGIIPNEDISGRIAGKLIGTIPINRTTARV